jgi:AcrR family transcriptional regulator
MLSLRERQKERRGQSILVATAKLLNSKGYQGTSIEDIAELAEVGVGTVYNYFNSKTYLVLELFRRDTEEQLRQGQKIVRNPPHDAIEAVSALFSTYVRVAASRYNKRILRELLVLAFNDQLSYGKEALKLDYMLISQVAELMELIRARGQLTHEVESDEAAKLLYTVLTVDLMMFIVEDEMTLDSLTEAIQRSVGLVFKGLLP